MKIKRSYRIVFLLFLGFIAWDLQNFLGKIFVTQSDSGDSVDLVAVLTGGQGRLKEALASFRDGRGQYLLISGTDQAVKLADILNANGIDDFPQNLKERVIIDSQSLRTLDNVVEIIRIADEKKLKSVKIITSNYHLPRTMKLLDRELQRRGMNPESFVFVQSPVESPNFPISGWWAKAISWQIFLSEYFKFRLLL